MKLFIFSLQTFSGCAVAFMFILILVGLAICRFHIKRRWSFRYYTNSASNESEGSLPSGSRIISSINIRQGRRCQRTRRSRQHLGRFIFHLDNWFSNLSDFRIPTSLMVLNLLFYNIRHSRCIKTSSTNNSSRFGCILFISKKCWF